MRRIRDLSFVVWIFAIISCSRDGEQRFMLHGPQHTGIDFRNDLTESPEFNIFNYMYFYNGGGVAVGDVNNDGLVDIYFTANQLPNKLYLNKGNFQFEDITAEAGVEGLNGWATGVTMADVNGDGRLDIYVSYVGDYLSFKGRNQLFINQGVDQRGIPRFTDEAIQFGLDLSGFSTQAAFFDYDLDGDLDMYMLNHSLHQNGTFGRRGELRSSKHPTAGDKLLRNDGNRFVEVTDQSGIYSSVLGYGLGIVVSDVNMDGWPDIYVGNDFHENDYLYINQRNGTFKDCLDESMNHTSRYTMGVDFADFNNDAFPDLIAVDMLPAEYSKLKASAAEDPYDIYMFKKNFGYNEQYTRNVLQINNRDGTFSDIGLSAQVYATDWSWAALMADFDLDGFKDIFVSNGILRRSNDLDYINFITVDTIQYRLQQEIGKAELKYIQKMPQVKIPNFLFRNNGDSTFSDVSVLWKLNIPSYSNGAAYADLDNDGDLDLVINNVNDVAFILENRFIHSKNAGRHPHWVRFVLQGTPPNTLGIGAKVFVYHRGKIQMQECMPTRGFQSSVDTRLVFGLGDEEADSVVVVWPSGKCQTIVKPGVNKEWVFRESDATGKFNYDALHPKRKPLLRQTEIQLPYRHKENVHVEFIREGLIPFMVSAEGPGGAVGDVNGDGRDDLFLGGAKWQTAELYLQQPDGSFLRADQPLFRADSTYEDVDAAFFDADGDGDLDLFVVSGGNEFTGDSRYRLPRLYINDGKGNFSGRATLPQVFHTGSCLAIADMDNDGDPDVFLGSRAVPWNYGIAPEHYLLINDGKGNFTDQTRDRAPDLAEAGMVTAALWYDVNRDDYPDLILAADWQPVHIYINHAGRLRLRANTGLESYRGWWRALAAHDFNRDGYPDIVAGNFGVNSKLKPSVQYPIKLYVNDFDGNDSTEQILTYYVNDTEYPFYTRDEMTKQLPVLKKKFLSYQKFSQAKFSDFFPSSVIRASLVLKATAFESMIFHGNENVQFDTQVLPRALQWSNISAICVDDLNGDLLPDLLLAGNFYGTNTQMGRNDASYGGVLINREKGGFTYLSPSESGFFVRGEVRNILPIKIRDQKHYLIIRNNEDAVFFTLVR